MALRVGVTQRHLRPTRPGRRRTPEGEPGQRERPGRIPFANHEGQPSVALCLKATHDLMNPTEGDQVQPGQEDRCEEDSGQEGLIERSPDAFRAGDEGEADPKRRPESECQPVGPPGFHNPASSARSTARNAVRRMMPLPVE